MANRGFGVRHRLLLDGVTHAIFEKDAWGCFLMCRRLSDKGKRLKPGSKIDCIKCRRAIQAQQIVKDTYGKRTPGIRVIHDTCKFRKVPPL